MSTTNVLPLFWHLSSTDKNTRLDATESLISSLEAFQSKHTTNGDQMDVDQTNGHTANGDDEAESEDSDADDSDESGVEVDASDDEDARRPIGAEEKELKRLDSLFEKENSEDVRYTIKRLARGLTSSRESSRLGFAVALTEVRSVGCLHPCHANLSIRSSSHG
jgi:DNA polymerase phi